MTDPRVTDDLIVDEVLAAHIGRVPVGPALDVGMGDGTLALWLAARGFDVVGVDTDAEHVAQARAQAAARGLALDACQADIGTFLIPPAAYNLITAAAVFHFLRPSAMTQLAPRLARGLRPGGYLYATVLTTDDPNYQLLREANVPEVEPGAFDLAALAPRPGERILRPFPLGTLRALFAGLDVVHYAEERYARDDDEGGYNAAAVLLARRLEAPLA